MHEDVSPIVLMVIFQPAMLVFGGVHLFFNKNPINTWSSLHVRQVYSPTFWDLRKHRKIEVTRSLFIQVSDGMVWWDTDDMKACEQCKKGTLLVSGI